MELNWKVEKLLEWLDGAMQGCGGRSARARSRRPWRTAERGRRRVLIGQRAPGRGEWRLGEAGLVRGDLTVSRRSEQAALHMAGRRDGSGERLGRV